MSIRKGQARSGRLESLKTGAGLVAASVVAIFGVMLVTAQLGQRSVSGEFWAWADTVETIGQPDLSLDDGVLDPQWSEPLDGLEVRLRAERTTWQSWQQPVVLLDIRNAGEKTMPAADLRGRVQVDRENGLILMRKPTAVSSTSVYYALRMHVQFDVESLPDLQPGETFSLPIALASTFRSYEVGLQADDVSIGMGRGLMRAEPQFVSNLVPVRILPPGVRSMQELAASLKQFDADGQPIEAGFVPAATTLVDGERPRMTFLVRNAGKEMFGFSFGGDYRGANRHNRFKIEVRDATGELLPDPAGKFGDFGGLLSRPIVEPGRIMPTAIDLTRYRTFPGPGRYKVSARFDMTDEHGEDGRDFNVPAETKFELTILPRTPARVTAVLDRLFSRCEMTSRVPLQETIEVICEFGQEAAVPGLARFARAGNIELRQAAIRGLGTIPGNASLNELLAVEPDPVVREAALLALGAFADDRAVQRAVAGLADADVKVRTVAATALGQMKTDAAIGALLSRFEAADSLDEAAAILAALGATGADEPFLVVSAALGRDEDVLRRAALSAVVRFAPSAAEAALRRYADDQDMNFRETVIRTLAETLRKPIDAEHLAPVILSRRGTHTIGDAPRLLRLYTDDKAAPTLLGCLDFDDPSIRLYYNLTIIQDQLACRTGLAIPWIGDLNRDGTPEEVQQNRETLARIKAWLDEFRQNPWGEPPDPWRLPHEQGQLTWGPENNGLRLRARLNCSVWPQDLPQVIIVEAINRGGSVLFDQRPEVIELEVDGDWYAHDPEVEPTVCGEWHAYKGHRWHSYQLSPHWKRISDGQPLDLTPGPHTTRIRIVPPPGIDRSQLLTSLPLEFRVVASAAESD